MSFAAHARQLRLPSLAVVSLAAAVTLAAVPGEAASRRGARDAPPAPQRSAFELQALVMEMADEYIAGLGEAAYLAAPQGEPDARGRWLVQSFLRNGVGAALDIGAGPNPNVSILDMLVLSSLQVWAFERNWARAGIDTQQSASALKRLGEAREQCWAAAGRVLDDSQLDTVRQLIDAWIEANPDRTVVSLVRFGEFTNARHLPAADHRDKAKGLLIDLDSVTESVDQARLLGERLVWFAGRFPYVLGEQSELTLYRVVAQPEFQELMSALESFKTVSAALTERLEGLPDEVSVQRVKTFEQLGEEREAAVQDAREALKQALEGTVDTAFTRFREETAFLLESMDTRHEELLGTARELHETIVASTNLARELQSTADAVDRVVQRFQEAPESPSEPIRIPDIRDAANETAEAAKHLTILLERTNEILVSDEWDHRLAELEAFGERTANKFFWRGLALVAVLLAGVAAIRLATARRIAPSAQDSSR